MQTNLLHNMRFLIFIPVLLQAASCKKFVEINPAPNLVETAVLFENDQTAISAVNGVYTQMRALNLSIANGGLSVYAGLSADEIYYTGASTTTDQFAQNNILPDNSAISSNFWSWAYRPIYQANSIIEGLKASQTVTDAVKKQLTGEMKVVRALYYFNLINLYGDVPLIVSTDYEINVSKPRTPVEEIYQQIKSDLLEAKELLKTEYPTTGKTRPNKWTASALLARVYLYQNDWLHAEEEATDLISSGRYSLVTNLTAVFLLNSQETIWEISSDNNNTAEGTFIPASTTVRPSYPLTQSLLANFNTGDQRKTSWLKSNIISGQTYYYPYKYKQKTTATPVSEYNIIFRLAEQYLIRAEARAQQDKIVNSQSDVNVILNRAGLLNTTANTKETLLDAIAHERQTELFTEWGHRWFDLKRTDKIDDVMGVVKGVNWQTTDALYPIPVSQIHLNVFLTQNAGY